MKKREHWVYLSAHFDDVVLSCGGVVWEQVQAGAVVEIWTLCAGVPGNGLSDFANRIHQNWKTGAEAVDIRRQEDIKACKRLGAVFRHFDLPDCIYRVSPVTGEPIATKGEDLWQPLREDERPLVAEYTRLVGSVLPREAKLVSPVTLGNHMDHSVTRAVAEGIAKTRPGRKLHFYIDYPYIIHVPEKLKAWRAAHRYSIAYPLSEEAIRAWMHALEAYASQIPGFWNDPQEMDAAMRGYAASYSGNRLWRVTV